MGQKRTHTEAMASSNPKPSTPQTTSPYIPLFTTFRSDLDTHHDRREHTIKASRDITAASKKIIFTLQRTSSNPSATEIEKIRGQNKQFHDTIADKFGSVEGDLGGTGEGDAPAALGNGGLDKGRYARQISGGLQEWVEAVGFETYLFEGRVLGWGEARRWLRELCSPPAEKKKEEGEGEGAMDVDAAAAGGAMKISEEHYGVDLGYEDYILGLYDMTGEIMRWGITGMATSGALPSAADSARDGRNVLTDLRALRAALESLEIDGKALGPFARDCEGKARVMRQSVEKVEKALYGLVVRGAERPKGWMPDLSAGVEVGVEG